MSALGIEVASFFKAREKRYNGKPDPEGECYKKNYKTLKQVQGDKK